MRDLPQDLAAGRCYLPADAIASAGLTPAHMLATPSRFAAVWQPWRDQARAGIAQGMTYALSLRSRRTRAASALPAILAARTLDRLEAQGGPGAAHVKVPRAEVRAILLRVALSLASRGTLQRLHQGTAL